MKSSIIKSVTVLLVAASTVSCIGPFRLTNKLYTWNTQVSRSKAVKELVFIGLCILPYSVTMLGDALIFNSIEFWSGSNPIAMKEGETEVHQLEHQGRLYTVTTTRNRMNVALTGTDQAVDFRYFPEEAHWYQMDGEDKGLQIN